MSPTALIHAETAICVVIGVARAQFVLWAFGVLLDWALTLNAVMFVLSYGKRFFVQLAFSRWAR